MNENKLYLLPTKDRSAYFEVVSAQMGITTPMVEKDYWVIWVLDRLFKIDGLKDNLTFKGGTSLSKVYNLIKRFSEDIDLSIDKSFLGFLNQPLLDEKISGKRRDVVLKELSKKCADYIEKSLIQILKEDFTRKLGHEQTWNIELDDSDFSKQTLIFKYPTVFADEHPHIRPAIKIEIGARAEHWPVSYQRIASYAKEFLKEKIYEPKVDIKVLNVERTFWEKATILHQYAHMPNDKKLPLRLARHYYDFSCLLNSPVKDLALQNYELLKKVSHHKENYFPSSWANYSLAKKGSLKLMPPNKISKDLENDYKLMRDMFIEEPPNWQNILQIIKIFEIEFNR